MKATMVEYQNDHGEWSYYRVHLYKPPRHALIEYGLDHFPGGFNENTIRDEGGELYYADEVRAYEIILDTEKPTIPKDQERITP